MDRQERIDFILEHYESPRHYGPTDPADMVMQGGNPGCGDIITVYLKADENDAIAGLSFEGAGCTISQAATSMVMEMFESKTLTDIENTAQDTIIDLLGRAIAATRPRSWDERAMAMPVNRGCHWKRRAIATRCAA